MKRHTVLRTCLKALDDNSIAIILGKSLQSEAVKYDRDHNIYLPNYDYMLSVALGICLSTTKKVYVICEEEYFIRNLSELMHFAVSNLSNVFLILICSGAYSSFKGAPTVFDSVNSKQGILYNMGFLVHNYTNHFKLSNTTKELSKIFSKSKGPLAAIINVEFSAAKDDGIFIDYKASLDKIKELSKNVEE